MKKLLTISFLLAASLVFAQNKDYPFRPIPFTEVKLTDNFWLPRLEVNRTVTIPVSFQKCDETGRIQNFVNAAEHTAKFCSIYPFDDSDLYKVIEGASYSLNLHPDTKLEHYVDSLITIIGKAQEADGYLYTIRTMGAKNPWIGTQRWEKENELSHELYNAGHLFEAASAHFLATKKRNLLDIALRNADLIDNVFGPGKRSVAPGHEVIEVGLVKLYRVTGNAKYLNLAKFFIDARGKKIYTKKQSDSENGWETGTYWQDHLPVTEQTEAIGHAVRAVYLYSGMADVAALTGNEAYISAINKIWENAVGKKTYITGGIGTAGDGERFGNNYELPNETAYCETCAAIGSVFWNVRMFGFHGEAKYFDMLEKTLYNGLIAGIGLDGKSFYYTNPMEMNLRAGKISGENKRSPWFGCSCCPTNICRLIPSVPGYIYARKDKDIYVNMFISSDTKISLDDNVVGIKQTSNYPWEGNIKINVEPEKNTTFSMLIRIPDWAKNEAFSSNLYAFDDNKKVKANIKINGQVVDYQIVKGYAVLSRAWEKGDKIDVELPMEIRKVVAVKDVKNNIGKVALQRGPLVFCAEFPDNNNRTSNLILPDENALSAEFKPDFLNGVVVIKGTAKAINVTEKNNEISTQNQPFLAIPYYARSNRGIGEMRVWFPRRVVNVEILSE